MKTMIWLLAGGLLFALAAAFEIAERPQAGPDPLCSDDPLFQEFLGEFETVQLPFRVSSEELIRRMESDKPAKKALSTKYGEILPAAREARFSRMGKAEVEPMVAFQVSENRAAVLFATSYPFREWVEITMATFDCLDGKLLDQRVIGHADNYNLQVFSIGKDLVVRSIDLARKENNESEQVAERQSLVAADFKVEGTSFFQIKKDGRFKVLAHDPATTQAIVP